MKSQISLGLTYDTRDSLFLTRKGERLDLTAYVAGGFLGHLAQTQREDPASLRQAMRYAMVMASFTIQHFSIEGMRHLRREAVEERMASLVNQAQAAS